MIVLFTDFGADDIYVPQVKAALLEHLRVGTDIVDLLHSVSNFHVRAGAHLLAALQDRFPTGTVFLTVVDPDVGTDRDAVILHTEIAALHVWLGPDDLSEVIHIDHYGNALTGVRARNLPPEIRSQ